MTYNYLYVAKEEDKISFFLNLNNSRVGNNQRRGEFHLGISREQLSKSSSEKVFVKKN